MNLKWRYGLLLVAPSLLLMVVAWMLGTWSPKETIPETTAETEPTESQRPDTGKEPLQARPESPPEEAQIETLDTLQNPEVEDDDSELRGRVVDFLEALHSRDPHEATEERELRIRTYATERLWNDIAPFISNEAEDQVLREDGLRVEATATVLRTEELSSYRMLVVAEIDVTVHEEGGVYSSYQPQHTTAWIKRDGEWYVNEAHYG